MFNKIIDFIFTHAKCPICKQVDHKANMSEKVFYWGEQCTGGCHRAFYHYRCREKTFNERPCECGKNWVKKSARK